MVIRLKLDYGRSVCRSASNLLLNSLEVVQNEARRIATVVFKTTRVDDLRILANESSLRSYTRSAKKTIVKSQSASLQDHKEELLFSYYFRRKCYILNPAYNFVVNKNFEQYFLIRYAYSVVYYPPNKRSSSRACNVYTTCVIRFYADNMHVEIT